MKPNYQKLNKDGVLWTLPCGNRQAVLGPGNKMLAYRRSRRDGWDWVHKGYRAS